MILAYALGCAATLAHVDPADAYTPPSPPPPSPSAPGSLWSEESTRALVGMDNNARQVGDLITVNVLQSTQATNGADTQLSRAGSASFGIDALVGVDTSILDANSKLGGALGVGGSSKSSTKGTGATSRTNTVSAVLTCTVVEVFPNGNLRIQGQGSTVVNNETQTVHVDGVARGRDIRLDNTISSDKLADAHVVVGGVGAVTSQQGQGWANTIGNAIWPF